MANGLERMQHLMQTAEHPLNNANIGKVVTT